MAERLKAAALKAVGGQPSVGSNPTRPANRPTGLYESKPTMCTLYNKYLRRKVAAGREQVAAIKRSFRLVIKRNARPRIALSFAVLLTESVIGN